MRPLRLHSVAGITSIGIFVASLTVLLHSIPSSDPPLGSHCACAQEVCPTKSNGRPCSCGCAVRADAQKVDARTLNRLASAADLKCTNGMAGPYPCADVDLMAFLSHGEIGTGTGNDVWGWTDPLTGREYALVGQSTGTAFVDITVPTRPLLLGNLPTSTANSIWRGIKVFSDHAFIVSEALNHGMQVFDLRQLRDVNSPPAVFRETAHYAGFGSTHTLAINTQTGFAYASGTRTCEGGLHVVDVREPIAPRAAGCFSLDGYTHEAQCVIYDGPDSEYRGREICFNSNEDTLTIVDATDKLEQVQISRTGYGGSAYTHQGWLTEDQRFFLVNDEGDEIAFQHPTRTWIWNVSNLDEPVISSMYDGPSPSIDHNLYIRGNLVYESNYRSGLRVLDASEVERGSLREVGFFDIYPPDDAPSYNGAWTSYPFFSSGSVAVNGIEQGLFVLKPRAVPKGQPADLSVTIAGPGNVAAIDRDWSFVVRIANQSNGHVSETRLLGMPPLEIISARPSQGECSIGSMAVCDLGSLAPGSFAFVVLTVHPPNEEGDFVSTAIVRAKESNGIRREISALTSTRGVKYAASLLFRRPFDGTTFWIGRNNTIQWTLRGVDGTVRIDLSRDDGATWTTLTDEAENVGFYDWTGSGPVTNRARVRVRSNTRPQLSQTSARFAIATR